MMFIIRLFKTPVTSIINLGKKLCVQIDYKLSIVWIYFHNKWKGKRITGWNQKDVENILPLEETFFSLPNFYDISCDAMNHKFFMFMRYFLHKNPFLSP